jgi:hypothetical protein
MKDFAKMKLSREARKQAASAVLFDRLFSNSSNQKSLRNEVGFWHCPRHAKSADGVARAFLILRSTMKKQYRPRKLHPLPDSISFNGEQWKVDKSGRFSVSQFGRCFSHKSGRLIAVKGTGIGYCQIPRGDGSRSQYLHRVVYELFVGEIPEGLHINHKDGNKANNHVGNLEVVSASENAIHARRVLKVGGWAKKNSVRMLDPEYSLSYHLSLFG